MNQLPLALGIYDDPQNQLQDTLFWDLHQETLAVFGAPSSGKTTLLKTLLLRLHQVSPHLENHGVYILDFANHLQPFHQLPCVTGYFDATKKKEVQRVFRLLDERFTQQGRLLRGTHFSQQTAHPLHTTFILDGCSDFFTEKAYAPYQTTLLKLVREGLSRGITVVLTASEPTVVPSRLKRLFTRTIALDLPEQLYGDLFTKPTVKPSGTPGRGLCNRGKTAYELQVFLPFPPGVFPSQAVALQDFLRKEKYNTPTVTALHQRKLRTLPDPLHAGNWEGHCTDLETVQGRFPVGLDCTSHNAVALDLQTAQSIALYKGNPQDWGNLMKRLLRTACAIPGVQFIFWDDGRKKLQPLASLVPAHALTQVTSEGALAEYLQHNGFPLWVADKSGYGKQLQPSTRTSDAPFTVFVLQSRQLFQQSPNRSNPLRTSSPAILDAVANNALFLFPDIPRASDRSNALEQSQLMAHHFLLEDVLHFASQQGKYTVFDTEQDDQWREAFDCYEPGDSFYWNEETASMTMLRLIYETEGDFHGI